MEDTFVSASYVTAPQINVASGVALAIALLNHRPGALGLGVRQAGNGLREAARAVQTQWAQQRPARKVDLRPFDNSADVAWGALIDRLAAQAALPVERHPEAAQAAALLDALELRSRSWLALRYNEQWAQGQRRLDRIVQDNLRGAVNALAGAAFLSEVEFAHAAYGEALGITARREDTDDNVAMLPKLRALADAIAEYGLQLAAQYRGADADTRRAIVAALRPIDEHRARYARNPAAVDDAVTPDTPLPEPA